MRVSSSNITNLTGAENAIVLTASDGEEPVVITQPKAIAKHYIKTWFVVDLLSALPINFMVGHDSLGGANRLPRLLKIPKLIRKWSRSLTHKAM